MAGDVPTGAAVFKDAALVPVFKRYTEFVEVEWPNALRKHGGDAEALEAAAKTLRKTWHGGFTKRGDRVTCVYCRGQVLCKQSVHRLVSAEEKAKHQQHLAAAAAYNARHRRRRTIILSFWAK